MDRHLDGDGGRGYTQSDLRYPFGPDGGPHDASRIAHSRPGTAHPPEARPYRSRDGQAAVRRPVRDERLHLDGQGSDAHAPRVGRRHGLERVRFRSRPVLLLRDERDRPPHHQGLPPAARRAGDHARRARGAVPPRPGPRDGQGDGRERPAHPDRAPEGRSAPRAPGPSREEDHVGPEHRPQGDAGRPAGRGRTGRGQEVPPRQDEGQEGPGHRVGPRRARTLSRTSG